MAENNFEELQCPWCHSSLGVNAVPHGVDSIECPGCQQRFYPDNDGDPEDATSHQPTESLDDFLDRKVRGKLPNKREVKRKSPESDGNVEGWSKWEHSSPSPRKPAFRREVRQSDEAGRLPKPLIEDLSHQKNEPPKFSELSHTSLPQEREIDSEQRRRRDVLQKGWDTLSDPTQQQKGPVISRKDSLQFERNLISTRDRNASEDQDQVEMKRHQFVAKDDKLTWDDAPPAEDIDDPGDFSIEKLERVQRLKTITIAMLGSVAVLAAAIGLFIGISKMQGQAVTTEGAENPGTSNTVTTDFSISSNYNNIISRLREFLEAEDVTKMLKFVRNRADVEPLARAYYKRHPFEPRLLRDIPSRDSIYFGEGFVVVKCVVGKNEYLWVPMEIAAGLKVDWEAVVGYSEMEWDDFKRLRPKTPTLFRVRLTPANYYNYGFTEDKFISMQISDSTLDSVFYGYIPRKGALQEEFVQLLPEAVGIGRAFELRAVLELRYPDEDSAANQIEVVSLKAPSWVYRRDLRATTQSLELYANDARIDGGGATLDKDLRIKGWDDNSTTLEWRVDIERPVQVSVFAVMANGGKSDKKLTLTAGPQRIEHTLTKTDDWNTYREVVIGEMDFPSPGNYTFRLKHGQRTSESLMSLDRLIFRSGNELLGSKVRDPLMRPLVHPIAILPDLKRPGNSLTDPERAAGWRMLFTGKDLKGWTGYRKKEAPSGWSAQANQLMLTEPGCGALMTTEEFEDFELKLEWQASDGQASGLFFRVVENKPSPEQTGIEIELNGFGYSELSQQEETELTENGAVKHLYPALDFASATTGWNTLHLRVEGKEFQYWINEQEMGSKDRFNITRPIEIGSDDWDRRVNDSRMRRFQRFAESPKGYIALEDAGTAIRFRKIKVLVLGKEQYRQ
ncbi:MAG: hypothetical protein ACI9R3_004912 [Verrucomicrobiales bacterium]|jgi:hypothetical protein